MVYELNFFGFAGKANTRKGAFVVLCMIYIVGCAITYSIDVITGFVDFTYINVIYVMILIGTMKHIFSGNN